MRRSLLFIALLFICALSSAQVTKVRGRVTDSQNGEGIPFVGVYFNGTTVGVTTDLDGYYNLETKNMEADKICVALLGYDGQERKVVPGAFTKADFVLVQTDNRLTGAIVKADNRRVRRLLAAIDAHRDRNNPEKRPYYTTDIYNKIELDLTHVEETLKGKRFLEECGFVFDYMDTSLISGMPYLPIMISESVTERNHVSDPLSDWEDILANKISGINKDNNLLTQFTGNMHLKANFYEPFINAFGIEFPSPIQNGGLLYYNYFIIDSLNVGGRKTYQVRYHPKNGISSPALDGEMLIDAGDYAIRSLRARMKKGGNVNWVRDMAFEAEFLRLPDSTWFYDRDKLYADFSVFLNDSSKTMSFLGNREQTYTKPRFSPIQPPKSGEDYVNVEEDSNYKDEAYWASARPAELSEREKGIYRMVGQVQDTKYYKNAYTLIYTLINGYYEMGPIGIGPYTKLISFNNVEGFRPQLGVRTSRDWSKKHRLGAYVAYGCKDRQFKGGATWELMFNRSITRKLTVDVKYDMFQLGRTNSIFSDGNIFASLLGKGRNKMCPVLDFSAVYDHEFNLNFNAGAGVSLKRFHVNEYVPLELPDGQFLNSLAVNEISLRARFSKDETVNRGYFDKIYVNTKYPVVTLDLKGSVPGLRKNDWGYFQPELTVDWRIRIPPIGLSRFHLNGGTVLGHVPYPLLHLFEANSSYLQDKRAFSCMDYFEFAADTWATVIWNHCFYGFFLGKIPLLRKLQLREEFSFKMAMGALSDRNNGDRTRDMMSAPVFFPEGMHAIGKVPYIEIGAGISNILRIFRVDCFWRITHRDSPHLFSVNLGAEFRF